jgi:hypothetical protein
MNQTDEFYIGWQGQSPAGLARHVRKRVAALLVLLLVLAGLLALAQRTVGVAVFEWGTLKSFTGTLKRDPYPHLLVQRPGQDGSRSAYYLVAPFKSGLKPDAIANFEGKEVTLKGTLIYRDNQTMIEAVPESIKLDGTGASGPLPSGPAQLATSLGRQTLVGEIVDSKCYLGVMNPGRLAPHRACAVRCISGGIPPILLVVQPAGPPLCFLLVSSDGRPVNKQVLDMIAEPIEITGEVVRQGELAILRADPATYRRLGK